MAVCPVHVQQWTVAQQAEAVAELQRLDPESVTVKMLVDYANMRTEAKTCVAQP